MAAKNVEPQMFGSFVAQCRKEKGLTQKQLAGRLNVSPQAVSKWERGLCLPDVSLWPALAEALEVTLLELLEGEKPSAVLSAAAEEQVARVVAVSSGQLSRHRRKGRWAALAGIVLLAAALLLAGIFYQRCVASVPQVIGWHVTSGYAADGDVSQWQTLFPPHSAYALGLNDAGQPVFQNPAAALRQIRTDCSDAVDYLRQEERLWPLGHFTVVHYAACGWQVDGGEWVEQQGRLLTRFGDIYENSFR